MIKGALDGRVVIVTGAARGIGRQIALACGRDGADVFATDLVAPTSVADEIDSLGGAAVAAELDVTNETHRKRIVGQASSSGNRSIWSLVNNAGIVGVGSFLETTGGQLDEQWEVNARGSFLMAQEVVRHMVERQDGGVIIQLASIGGVVYPLERAAYAMSKHASMCIVKAIAAEHSVDRIRAVGLCPNRVATDIAVERAHASRDQWVDMHSTQMSGEMIPISTIAELAAFVMRPGLVGINGVNYEIPDGATAVLPQMTFPDGKAPKPPDGIFGPDGKPNL